MQMINGELADKYIYKQRIFRHKQFKIKGLL